MRALLAIPIALLLFSPLSGQNTRWNATRDLRIGDVDDPDYTLTWARGVLLDRTGNMYVLHPAEHLLRVFGPDGRLRLKIGREGSGPGEFRGAAGLGWRADTLWVYDSRQARLSLFRTDGSFVSSLSVMSNTGGPAQSVRGDGLFADGTMTGRVSGSADAVANGTLTTGAVLRLSREAVLLDTLVTYSLHNTVHRITDPDNPRGVRSYSSQPFSDAPLLEFAQDRTGVYVVDRPAATSRQGVFTLTRIDLKGDTVFRRSYNYVPQRLSKAEVDSLVAQRVKIALTPRESMPATLQPATAEKFVRRELYVPEHLPPVQQVLSGSDGTIWLQREHASLDLASWNVLDGNGQLLATVQLPRRMRVLAATRAFVVGEEYDDLEVPYMSRYRISAAATRR